MESAKVTIRISIGMTLVMTFTGTPKSPWNPSTQDEAMKPGSVATSAAARDRKRISARSVVSSAPARLRTTASWIRPMMMLWRTAGDGYLQQAIGLEWRRDPVDLVEDAGMVCLFEMVAIWDDDDQGCGAVCGQEGATVERVPIDLREEIRQCCILQPRAKNRQIAFAVGKPARHLGLLERAFLDRCERVADLVIELDLRNAIGGGKRQDDEHADRHARDAQCCESETLEPEPDPVTPVAPTAALFLLLAGNRHDFAHDLADRNRIGADMG